MATKYKRCVKFKCMKSRFGHGRSRRCKRGYVPRCTSWAPTHKSALGRRRRKAHRR